VVATEDNWLNGVIVDIDDASGWAKSIVRLNYQVDLNT
jgi:hypothetical protein